MKDEKVSAEAETVDAGSKDISHELLHMQTPKILKYASWEKLKIFILLFGILPINDNEEDQTAKLAISEEQIFLFG